MLSNKFDFDARRRIVSESPIGIGFGGLFSEAINNVQKIRNAHGPLRSTPRAGPVRPRLSRFRTFWDRSKMTSTQAVLTLGCTILAVTLVGCGEGGTAAGVGSSCTDGAACPDRPATACIARWPGGYCTEIDCKLGSCPGGSRCVTGISFPNVSLDKFCLVSCSTDRDCRDGYRCATVAGADRVCAPTQ